MKGIKYLLLLLSFSLFALAALIFAASVTGYRYNILTHDIDRPGESTVKHIGNISLIENGVFLEFFPVNATFYPDLSMPLVYNPDKTVFKVNDYDELKKNITDFIDNSSRTDFQRAVISGNGLLSDEGHISEQVKIDELIQDIENRNYDGEFELADYYEESDTEQIALFRNFSKKIQDWNIRYTNGSSISFNDVEFVVSASANTAGSEEELMKSLSVSENIGKKVRAAINSYDTSGSLSFNFVRHDGEETVVKGGTWGDVVDTLGEWEAVRVLGASLVSESSRKPLMKVEMDNYRLPDTYIEVDKSEQRVYYYVSGNCTVSSDCVTGKRGGRETPTGAFYITEKKKEKDLKGADYISHVHRWLRLTWAGVGLHDATWRNRFGGNIWQTSGSHGCINLPKNFAYQLYDMVESGTCVIVY